MGAVRSVLLSVLLPILLRPCLRLLATLVSYGQSLRGHTIKSMIHVANPVSNTLRLLQHVQCLRIYRASEGAAVFFYYSFAFCPRSSSFLHRSIRPHENLPYGPIKSPISFAFSLLACRCAYLAAIPCMITPLRKVAKLSPHASSDAGFQPATSLYHETHCAREGRPGVLAEGEKARLVRGFISSLGGSTAKQYGDRRFERSESG